MKHVGLNVASDPFMSSALTGANGGLVVVVGDDPGMHSSQNEQDSRFYAGFAKIPCLEPGNQQECYDMTRDAFRLSEQLGIPVMIRLVTRLAHSRSNVEIHHANERSHFEKPLQMPDVNDWTLVPVNARRRYRHLLDIQEAISAALVELGYNRLQLAGGRGILCSSTGWNYVREVIGEDSGFSLLRVATYPLPVDLIRQLVDHCHEITVIEEGYPLIEQQLRGLLGVPGKSIRGKLDGMLAEDGELLPETVAKVLGYEIPAAYGPDSILAGRPPQFCKGCPHANSFGAMIDATAEFPQALLFGDIGCYALGIMPPYRAVHSCVDMGASIGLAFGAWRAGAWPVLCTIGDSTFAHSRMTPLLDAVLSDADITVIILDNATTAMTGAQESHATGEQLIEILKGLGVKHLEVFEPLPKNHGESVEILRRAIEHKGLSVVVARRACVRIKVAKLTEVPQSE